MELEMATMSDIVEELRKRRVRFVFVAFEPSNSSEATILHAAQGLHARDMLGLVKMAWQEVIKENGGRGGLPPKSLN